MRAHSALVHGAGSDAGLQDASDRFVAAGRGALAYTRLREKMREHRFAAVLAQAMANRDVWPALLRVTTKRSVGVCSSAAYDGRFPAGLLRRRSSRGNAL